VPHHWKPFDPGNPDCQTVVEELKKEHGDRLKYVGFDGEKCWALYETGQEEREGAERPHPCERPDLKDEYVKDGLSGA
jgi:hypothetical protein